jgi:hypothetical protein
VILMRRPFNCSIVLLHVVIGPSDVSQPKWCVPHDIDVVHDVERSTWLR